MPTPGRVRLPGSIDRGRPLVSRVVADYPDLSSKTPAGNWRREDRCRLRRMQSSFLVVPTVWRRTFRHLVDAWLANLGAFVISYVVLPCSNSSHLLNQVHRRRATIRPRLKHTRCTSATISLLVSPFPKDLSYRPLPVALYHRNGGSPHENFFLSGRVRSRQTKDK
ncbi:hypothetical protein F4824DRAFT_29230 [Ustulina deusta]|nr:hypothetical protein F4823DRAFT_402810 [Ustulina deusta]KAI3343977.1 hypothetical protein F4824DRAFT_29230 [Ustulina deusta]